MFFRLLILSCLINAAACSAGTSSFDDSFEKGNYDLSLALTSADSTAESDASDVDGYVDYSATQASHNINNVALRAPEGFWHRFSNGNERIRAPPISKL
ncbi:hypothetical protein [Alteromonas oceanisediminis]|uniref:hypothetical protein n=1 Tax=Alteromonas oceanisediminis TaxID=2836180 RepID=UPI001BD993E4|nr:hypothetical protein [Alteromonas oceanisediminis]MBT0587595.1 hypothetical protein [Alteromonas oceanisediminis]